MFGQNKADDTIAVLCLALARLKAQANMSDEDFNQTLLKCAEEAKIAHGAPAIKQMVKDLEDKLGA